MDKNREDILRSLGVQEAGQGGKQGHADAADRSNFESVLKLIQGEYIVPELRLNEVKTEDDGMQTLVTLKLASASEDVAISGKEVGRGFI